MAPLRSAFGKLAPGRATAPALNVAARSTAAGAPGWKAPALTAASAAPAAAPATPAAAAGAQALPINPQYGADVNAAQRNLDTALQTDQAQRAGLGATYGLGVDATGNVIDDKSNPYSRAAALQTAYDQSVRGTNNSYAARGQLYSGAIQNAQNWNATQNGSRRDALIREFTSVRTGLDSRDLSARNAYQAAVDAAGAQNIQYGIDHPPDAASVPAVATARPSSQDAASAANGGAPKITANYKAPSGARGILKVYPNGRKVFVPNG